MPALTPQPQDALWDRRRSAILESAERLIAVRGVDALRLRDVAHEAGVSIGLLQHYFVSRDDLVRETVHAANASRVAEWSELANGFETAYERLTALLRDAVADHHRCIVWLETCAAASRHPELRPDVERTQRAWSSTLREVVDGGILTGEFKPSIATADVVALFIHIIDGLMMARATETENAAATMNRGRILFEAAHRLLQIPGSIDDSLLLDTDAHGRQPG